MAQHVFFCSANELLAVDLGWRCTREVERDLEEMNDSLLLEEVKPPSDRISCPFPPKNNYKCGRLPLSDLPKLERVLDRSIKAFLPGLLIMDRLAREMSAVTRVMVILEHTQSSRDCGTRMTFIVTSLVVLVTA